MHGIEPSHHIACMYSYVGGAWKIQERVRMIIDSIYHDRPDGYAGNEDCGQISAWGVWSCGTLEFVMGDTPNKLFGKKTATWPASAK